jgi:hypothetical protein
MMPKVSEGWARIKIPKSFQAGPSGIAKLCDWEFRKVDPEFTDVRTREGYRHLAPTLISLFKVASIETADNKTGFDRVGRWWPQDSYDKSGQLAARGMSEVQRLIALGERVATWEAFRLGITAGSDKDWIPFLAANFERIGEELPAASIWAVEHSRMLYSRHHIVQTLFGAEATPELLVNPDLSAQVFRAGSGLLGEQYHVGHLIEPALVVHSPWVIGIQGSRMAGLVVLIFGGLESGRPSGSTADLINLFRPRLMSSPMGNVGQPAYSAADGEELLAWWVSRVNLLVAASLDVVNFTDGDGYYQPDRHFAALLSMDRLFAVVQDILVGSRRDEFTRRMLLFEAVDLLEGLGLGGPDVSFSYKATVKLLERVVGLPPGAARCLEPRCRTAADALRQVQSGFFVKNRVEGDTFIPPAGAGQPISIDGAASRYLWLLRNAAHSYRKAVEKPLDRALFASHTGDLSPELSDLPLIHLLALLAEPNRLFRPRRSASGRVKA